MTRRTEPLAEALLRFREARGLTRYALAEKAEVAHRTVRLLETGKTKSPTVKVLSKIAKALGVSMDQLLELPTPRRGPVLSAGLPTVPPRILMLLRQPRTRHLLRLLKEAKIERLRELLAYLLLLASPRQIRR